MNKTELLKIIDDELLDKLFGFCYSRTSDSYEAEELCSDILFALVKAANSEGEIESIYPFIWRVAHNVYADFSKKRRISAERFYEGDSEEELLKIASIDGEDADGDELYLKAIYQSIAFLSKAYREVMIAYYLDNQQVAQIAAECNISETAVRQRLFSARNMVKSEVNNMDAMNYKEKPVALQEFDFVIWGKGNPDWGDPRDVYTRQFSNHVVWLCRNKPMNAKEISEKLNVPMMYVEEELKIQSEGENGKYGLLKKLDNGRYTTNFILFDKEEITRAHNIYIKRLPKIIDIITAHIEQCREEYLAFPYLNEKVDFNLILWQQIKNMENTFRWLVDDILEKVCFADVKKSDRPFSVFGYLKPDNAKEYGIGSDGVAAYNVGGYSEVHLSNIYGAGIAAHFRCGHSVANDMQILLMLRAVEGLEVESLGEKEKEYAAKAIEQGYIYRDGDMLYTKILVCTKEAEKHLFDLNNKLFEKLALEAKELAGEMAAFICECVPRHLLPEYKYANALAAMPLVDGIIEALITKGYLVPPENGIGAEGCWMIVEK